MIRWPGDGRGRATPHRSRRREPLGAPAAVNGRRHGRGHGRGTACQHHRLLGSKLLLVLQIQLASSAGAGPTGEPRRLVVVTADDVVLVSRRGGRGLVVDADAGALAVDDRLRVAVVAQHGSHVGVVVLDLEINMKLVLRNCKAKTQI